MNIKQAIGILQTHNKWRRGCDIEPMTNPTTLGIAIDTVIEHVKNNGVSYDVIKCDCTACSGSGRYCEYPCSSCEGTGKETDL